MREFFDGSADKYFVTSKEIATMRRRSQSKYVPFARELEVPGVQVFKGQGVTKRGGTVHTVIIVPINDFASIVTASAFRDDQGYCADFLSWFIWD